MRFFSMILISASERPAFSKTYFFAPPYLPCGSSSKFRNASMVSALQVFSEYIACQMIYSTHLQQSMFSAASLFVAKMGSLARRAIIISRAGSRPSRVRAKSLDIAALSTSANCRFEGFRLLMISPQCNKPSR